MEKKLEVRVVCTKEIYDRINAQAANLGQKPCSFARQVIMERVCQLEMQASNIHALKIMETLQKMEENGK